MKKREIFYFIILTLLLIGSHSVFADTRFAAIDGYCYLDGEESHEGTKILFTAVTPSAITDSTYTNEDGYFQISINEGIYSIEYSHEGWQSINIAEELLLNDSTFETVTLLYGLPLDISGEISGILTNEYIYQVIDNITVNENDTLTIEPGVRLEFADGRQLIVSGMLTAEGTEEDSITFTSNNYQPFPGIWTRICFEGNSSSSSTVSYCKIEYADNGITCIYSSPTIINNTISDNGYGIVPFYDSSPTITGNSISNNSAGIHCNGNASPFISSNMISNNENGIYCFDSSPTITNNSISNNDNGIFCEDSTPSISSNTISNNDNGIFCNDESIESIIGNIFYENSFGFYGDMSPSEVVYNLFWMSDVQVDMPNLFGEILSSNINGDPCDIYCNLFMDPLFVDAENGDFHLTEASPCVDAGNPDPIYFDPDGTIADIGAFYYPQAIPGHNFGDVDDNEIIGAFDASLVLQYFCLLIPEGTTLPWEDWRIDVADVDGNGVVEAFDASLILQFSVGFIDEFPVENLRRKLDRGY